MSIEPVRGLPDRRRQEDALQQLRHALAQVHAYLPQLAGDIEAQVHGYQELEPLKKDIGTLMDDLKQMVLTEAGRDRHPHPDVDIRKSIKRTEWASKDLLRHLIINQWGGDMDLNPLQMVELMLEVLETCVPFTGSLAWRVGALKEYGVTPDEWCKADEGHLSVSIRGKQ